MKRLMALALSLILAGCGRSAPSVPAAESATQAPALQTPVAPVTPPPPPPQTWQPSPIPTRDERRDQLLKLMNEAGADAAAKLKGYYAGSTPRNTPFLQAADLDGDGQTEYVLALPVFDDDRRRSMPNQGAALFVVYQVNGQWAVDRSEPMSEGVERNLMAPGLLGAADLTGAGHPQIVWYRPEIIATGPQPYRVFVTAWRPGSFTHLPGEMAICPTYDPAGMAIEGRDLLLTGVSREEWFVRLDPTRTDRYRFVDGAFRLVDRRFLNHTEFGYDRFWDALVAEGVGRIADAEADFRAAAEPTRQAHAGSYPVYHQMPYELTPAEMAQFAKALRPFARFRLGGLLLQAGRQAEALAVLQPDDGPYTGLTEAMRIAPNRAAGCQAATNWATANPQFLASLNVGVGHSHWTPELLCGYMPLEERRLDP